jgi:hypothetical protein
MIIALDNGFDTYCLGIQTTPKEFNTDAHKKCVAWKPTRARSYNVLELQSTNYSGRKTTKITGYGHVLVQYFTTKREGQYLC